MNKKVFILKVVNYGIILLLLSMFLPVYLESGLNIFADPDDCIYFAIMAEIILNSILRLVLAKRIDTLRIQKEIIDDKSIIGNPQTHETLPIETKISIIVRIVFLILIIIFTILKFDGIRFRYHFLLLILLLSISEILTIQALKSKVGSKIKIV